MSRRRYISTTMSTDSRLNRLAREHGDFAALLYTWMIPHADDGGMLRGDLEEVMAMVVPLRRDKSLEDMRAAIEGMASLGLVEWDEAAGIIAFPAAAYFAHQTYITPARRQSALNGVGGRRSAAVEAQDGAEQRKSPQIAEDARAASQGPPGEAIAEDQRKTPQNGALFSSSSSSSFKSSSSLELEVGSGSSSSSPACEPAADPPRPAPAQPNDLMGTLQLAMPHIERDGTLWDEALQLCEDVGDVTVLTRAIAEARRTLRADGSPRRRLYPSDVREFLPRPEEVPRESWGERLLAEHAAKARGGT